MSGRDKRLDRLNKPRSAEFWKEPPPRWRDCPPIGGIIADLFVPFKTPLSSTYDSSLPPAKRFGVDQVFETVEEQGKSIGLWIDLTNTDRFYPKTSVNEAHNPTVYMKSPCTGHDACPSAEQTHLFTQICQKYCTKHPDSLIGIHCTHGFNRTGFLICAYLVEEFDWSIGAAVETFAKARPPGIYKHDYLNALYERYNAEPEERHPAPALPLWCYDENDQLDDDGNEIPAEVAEDDEVKQFSRPRKNRKEAKFMEGVPGVVAVRDPEIIQRVQQKCKAFCKWNCGTFGGCQPVSMDHDNKHLIKNYPYRVSWKADGVRYMLLIDGEDDVYFLDRNNDVFKVEGMNFPLDPASTQSLRDTLLDGEMIIDKVSQGVVRPRFLVYDMVHYMDDDIGGSNFDNRCKYIKTRVIAPRDLAAKHGKLKKEKEPFSIRWKDFFPVKARDAVTKADVNMAQKLLGEKFRQQMSHEVDGLVFQRYDTPYTGGRNDLLLKWKPPSQCTVDFKLVLEKLAGQGCVPKTNGALYVSGLDRPFGHLKPTKGWDQLHNKIIECRHDNATGKWIFDRVRTDKNTPNHYTTAQAVMKGILQPLTKEDLMQFIDLEVPYLEDVIAHREREAIALQFRSRSKRPANGPVSGRPDSYHPGTSQPF